MTMNRRTGLRAALGLAALGANALLTACGGNSEKDKGSALARLLNASTGYAALDLAVADKSIGASPAYGQVSGYTEVDAGSGTAQVAVPGSGIALATATYNFVEDQHLTVVAYGPAGSLKTLLINDEASAADSGKARLLVHNLAVDAGALDVYLTGATDALDAATALATGVEVGASAGYTTVGSGTYRLRVTGKGDKADLRLDVQGLVLGSTQVASLLLTTGVGGVLVNALLLPQQGGVTGLANAQARVRLVASAASNGRVTAAVGGQSLLVGAVSPTISSGYKLVAMGSQPVSLSIDGTAVTVPDAVLTAGGDHTLLVWGTAAAPQWSWIADDNRLPTVSSNARIRLVHGVNGLAESLTLTINFSAVAADVAPGQASAYATLAAGTGLRLDISTPQKPAVVPAMTDVTLAANHLYTVFVLGDAATLSAAAPRLER